MNKSSVVLEYINLTGDGGVLKKIELEGFGGLPPPDSEVTLNYEGHLEDGRIIDNTRIRQEAYSIILGKGNVINGLEIAVLNMKVGEKAKVKIRSDYGYGNKDLTQNVAPKPIAEMEENDAKKYSNLVYEIELVKYDKVRKSKTQMDFDERIAEAVDLKENGNELFKQKRFREAIIRYEDGFKFLTQIPTQQLTPKIVDLRLNLTLNITNCFLQLYEFHYALKKVNEAFDIRITPKCYYYRCNAYMHLAEFVNAEKDLNELEKLLPGENQVEKTKKELETLKEKYNKEKKAMFKKGLFKSGLYEDIKIKVKGPYPELDYNNLFVFFDILINFKSANFKDPKKIKLEIYKNLHKELALFLFDLAEKNKEFFKKKFLIKKYENDIFGLCLFENSENELDKYVEETNNLPLIGNGLLIFKKQTKEIFLNLNEFPSDLSISKEYLVIGKICYNENFINQIYHEIRSSLESESNIFNFDIKDHGRALTI